MRVGTAKDWRAGSESSPKSAIKDLPAHGKYRVIKDSPVRGKFSRSQIRTAVETVARRHGAT